MFIISKVILIVMIQLKTKNQNLVNTTSNGVPYIKKCFILYGIEVCGVFPVFEGIKVTLDGTVDSIYKELGNTDYALLWKDLTSEDGFQQCKSKILKPRKKKFPDLSGIIMRNWMVKDLLCNL